MEWYEYWLIFYGFVVTFGVAATIASVGRPKEPTSGAVAVIVTIIWAITLVALYNVLTA